MNKKNSETVGIRIKRLRVQESLTQDALAKKSGVSCATIVKFENEKIKRPWLSVILKITKSLGIDMNTFVLNLKI